MSSSNIISIAGGIAGAYLGAMIAGPKGAAQGAKLGWAIGSSVATMVFGEKPTYEVGKLSDLRVTGSGYGTPWPRVWGSVVIGAQVIWVQVDANGNHLRQTKETDSNKQGTTVTYTTYSTFAVAFCLGEMLLPDPDDALGGEFVYRGHQIMKMWAGQELIYDRTAGINKHGFNLWPGTETQAIDPVILAVEASSAGAHRGLVGAAVNSMNVTPFGSTLPAMRAEIKTETLNLASVFRDLLRIGGVPESRIDVTALSGHVPVTKGVVWDSQDAPRIIVEQLLLVENLDYIEADGKIIITPRVSGTVYDVPADWLGSSTSGQSPRLKKSKVRADDLPSRVSLTFLDPDADYQQNTVLASRQTVGYVSEYSINSRLVMTATDAQKVADRELDRKWAERVTVEFSLPLGALQFVPGDKVNVPDISTGKTLRVRLTSMKMSPFGQVDLTGTEEDPDVFDQVATGSPGNSNENVLPVVPSVFVARSVTEVLDEHQRSPGFYVGASGGEGWRGGQVFYKHNDATDYTQGQFLADRAVFGTATSALASFAVTGGTLQISTTVGVDLTSSLGSLQNVDDTAVQAGSNWAWLGSEVIGFGTASLTATHQYTLSRIVRRLRGSSGSGHAIGEPILLATNSVVHVPVPESHVGATYQVKVVSPGQAIGDVTPVNVVIQPRTPTETEVALSRVLSPVYITPIDITGSLTFDGTWRSYTASSIPASAKVLIMYIEYFNDSGSATKLRLEVRKPGATDSYKIAASSSNVFALNDVTSPGHQAHAPVEKTFEYRAPSGWITKVEIQGYMATPA